MARMKNEVDITVELRVHIARKYKTQSEAAKAWECSPAFVSSVLQGKKHPNDVMLSDAGFVKIQAKPAYIRKQN